MTTEFWNPPTVYKVKPYGMSIASTEQFPVGLDATDILEEGQSVSTPSTVFTDVTNQPIIVDLTDPPSVEGDVVVKQIAGSTLTPGHIYQLAITFVADVNTTVTMIQSINCPF